ncbi:MAG: hypothetical protein IT494_05165 [Gammaproteobacteria bacterium]|nr:hypothetical protein [Gammaproteobacteria bacterium]
MLYSSGSPAINNAGTLTKNGAGEWYLESNVGFSNAGTFVSNAGQVRYRGFGTSTGTFNVGSDATLWFDSSVTKNLGDGALITGAGAFNYTGNGMALTGLTTGATIDQPFSLDSESIGGTGILNVNGAMTVTGTSSVGGTLVVRNGLTVQGVASAHAQLTVGQNLVNDSTVTLTSTDAVNVRNATIAVTSGSLINNGAIDSVVGARAGGRTITAQLDNRSSGAINVGASAPLTINKNGANHLNAGAINVTGDNLTVTSSTPMTFTHSAGTINIATGQTFTFNNGTFFWNGGAIEGGGEFLFLPAGGSDLVIGGADDKILNNIDLTPANLTVGGTGTLILQTGANLTTAGTTTVQSGARIDLVGGDFIPTGTSLNIDGELIVRAGQDYDLALGGVHTGTFNVEAGATLNFIGGTHHFADGALLTGPGAYNFGGGIINFTGTGSGTTIDLPTTITFTDETIGGSGNLNNNGALIIEGLTPMTNIHLSSTNQVIVRGTEAGDTTWTLAGLDNTGTMNVTNIGSVARTVAITTPLSNSGTITVAPTTGGPLTATFTGGLTQTGGSFNAMAPATINGAVTQTGGALVAGALTTVTGAYQFGGGTIAGTGQLEIGGAMTITGSGTRTIAVATRVNGLTISSGITLAQSGTALDNLEATTIQASAGLSLASGASHAVTGAIDNQGSLTIGSGTTASAGGNYTQSGAGACTVDGTLTAAQINIDGGTMTGTGRLNGPVTVAGTLLGSQTINGAVTNNGTLAGTQVITGNVINNALLVPGTSPGRMSITGNLTLSETSALRFELAGTGSDQFDLLAVSGNATLAGAMSVIGLSGFRPASGDNINVITCGGTCSGTLTLAPQFDLTVFDPSRGDSLRGLVSPTAFSLLFETSYVPPPPEPEPVYVPDTQTRIVADLNNAPTQSPLLPVLVETVGMSAEVDDELFELGGPASRVTCR